MKHLMFTRLAALVIASLFATPSLADNSVPPRFPTGQVSSADIQAYLAEVKAIPDVRCEEAAAHQLKCDSGAQRTIWVFTLEGHPAHPAVSRGVMVVNRIGTGMMLGIDRSGHYAGDAAAFNKWFAEFAELDTKQVAEWNRALQR